MQKTQQVVAAAFAGKSGHAYITGIRRPVAGFLVRVPDSDRPGKYRQKSFCSLACSPDDLLAAAIAWRDAQFSLAFGRATPPVRAFHKSQANSATQIPGVRRTIKVVKKTLKDGTVQHYRIDCFIAEVWLLPGKDGKRPRQSRSRIFSVNKYTEARPLWMAAAWRAEQEAILAKG